jgi:hypothetical protein
MEQRRIDGDTPVQPWVTAMEARQQEFNASINLLVPSKVGYLYYVQDGGPRNVHGPRLGDDLRLLPLGPSQILVWCEHAIVLAVF